MARRDLIVIGTSAGGVEALAEIVRGLPTGFPASLFIVCHIPAGARSLLPEILSRSGPLLAIQPADGEPFYPGHVYVAPPDHHLVLAQGGRMRLSRAARENHHRPAIDPLFRSAARAYGPRVVGVVLTGHLHDGTAGLMAIRAAGGVAVVQDPAEALVDVMPRTARDIAGADHVLRLSEMGPALVGLVIEPPARGGVPMAEPEERAEQIVDEDKAEQAAGERNGEVSLFTCPECGGSLWQLGEDRLLQFRCHVGHAYYADALMSEHSEHLEAALWTAVRMFKERAVLSRQLAERARAGNQPAAAERYAEQA